MTCTPECETFDGPTIVLRAASAPAIAICEDCAVRYETYEIAEWDCQTMGEPPPETWRCGEKVMGWHAPPEPWTYPPE